MTKPTELETVVSVAERYEDESGINQDKEMLALDSSTLLKGKPYIVIVHQGERYLLKTTKQGKLVLNK